MITEKRRAQMREWQRKNRVKTRALSNKWKKENAAKVKEYRKAYYAKNKTLENTRNKTWKDQHYDEVLLMNGKRRALVAVGAIIKEEIHNWDSRICGICGVLIEGAYHYDHILPLSRGGEHTTSNIQLTHPVCNLSKNNKLPEEMNMILLQSSPADRGALQMRGQ